VHNEDTDFHGANPPERLPAFTSGAVFLAAAG